MKINFIRFLCLPFMLLLFSCSNDDFEQIKVEEQQSLPLTKGLSYDQVSSSNPDLHSNWENTTQLILNGGLHIDAPWTVSEGNSINIPEHQRTDIKREDGWILLSHTLLDQKSADPNYILFYNTKRGILNVFYFNSIPMLNNSLVWVLESNINTSLFYSNVNVTNDTFTTYKYITTSNIVEDSDFNFGQLNYGWNLCSFELFYEKVSGNPILSIKAYNAQSGQIGLNGNFSGQVKIPKIVTTGPLDGVSKIINAISSVTGHFLEKIPGISSIYDAISAGSSIIGKINAFTSKSKVVYVDAKTSGNIELDGVLMVSLGGAVSHLNDLNLKRLNNNKELGVWTLNDNLVLNYNTCNEALPLNSSELRTTVKHWLDNGLINKIVINPDIIDQIQSYRIVGYDILLKNSDENFNNQKLAEYCYRTNMQSEFLGDVSSFYAENYNKLCTVVKKTMLLPSELYVNLNIEIIYKDGSKFLSSRNYKPIINAVDNYQFYLEESMKPNRAILFL